MTQPPPPASSTFDVAIVGAGPAGASAARLAAAAGLNTLILEKAAIPRYKTCGGGILGRAMHYLGEPVLPKSVVDRTCHTATVVLSDRLRFSATREGPVVTMTMRDRFDEWLTRKAVAAGARLR